MDSDISMLLSKYLLVQIGYKNTIWATDEDRKITILLLVTELDSG